MKKRYLTWLPLLLMEVFMAASLGAQAIVSQPAKEPFYTWGGLQIGVFGSGGYGEDGLVGLGCDFSVQLGRKIYVSIYHFSGSAFLGDDDAIDESSFMVGRCFRTKRAFTGAAIGLGWLNGWLGPSVMNKEIGMPLKLEGALIISRYLALSLQIHAFIWKHPYTGWSLGLQLGKLR